MQVVLKCYAVMQPSHLHVYCTHTMTTLATCSTHSDSLWQFHEVSHPRYQNLDEKHPWGISSTIDTDALLHFATCKSEHCPHDLLVEAALEHYAFLCQLRVGSLPQIVYIIK